MLFNDPPADVGEADLVGLTRELLHWARTSDVPPRQRRQIELVCKAVLEGHMALLLYRRLEERKSE